MLNDSAGEWTRPAVLVSSSAAPCWNRGTALNAR